MKTNWIVTIIIVIMIVVILKIAVSNIFMKYALSSYDIIKCNLYNFDIDAIINNQDIIVSLMYMIIGVAYPNKHLYILFVNIVYEIVNFYLGNTTNYVISPILNTVTYSIGSAIRQ